MTSLRSAMLTAAVLAVQLLAAAEASAQAGASGAPFGGAMDDHFRRDAARGEGRPSRAFAFAAQVEGAVLIERVDEQRQARGGPRFVLTVRNRLDAVVPSVEILALVVAESGTVSAVQPAAPLKNMKGGQTKRHDVELRGVILAQTDHIAFVIAKMELGPGEVWSAPESDLREMAGEAALALFHKP